MLKNRLTHYTHFWTFGTLLHVEKTLIRGKILRLRVSQPEHIKRKRDRAVCRRIENMLAFKSADEFFTYMAYKGEVDTFPLVKKYFGRKTIVIPKVQARKMELFVISDPHHFEVGEFGILEPKLSKSADELKKIDIAFVPGIAFDLTGHRIGFGGGYFDRFLKEFDGVSIGLAYEFQIVDKVPARAYDVPVHYIVTEKRIITCMPAS